MMNPDFHMTLYISEEVIRMGCATIGFIVAVWGIVKIIGLIAKANSTHQTIVKETQSE